MRGNDTVFLVAIKANYVSKKNNFLCLFTFQFLTGLQGECVRIGKTNSLKNSASEAESR